MGREIVFDSSSLISLVGACTGNLVPLLSSALKSKFWISKSIESESVIRPLQIKRFELNALRIKELIMQGYLQIHPDSKELKQETDRLLGLANSIYEFDGHKISIIHLGEAETLAIANLTEADVFCIDERTTRMLIEDPRDLRQFISFKYKADIRINERKLKEFQDSLEETKVIRSSELAALAFEKGFIKDAKFLEGILFALKYGGCSISEQEIIDYLKEAGNKK
jgi:hypothetical protein